VFEGRIVAQLGGVVDWRGGPTVFFSDFIYAAAVSVVELDVLTGEQVVVRSELVYDAGQSLNPYVDIGQIEGAFVQVKKTTTTTRTKEAGW